MQKEERKAQKSGKPASLGRHMPSAGLLSSQGPPGRGAGRRASGSCWAMAVILTGCSVMSHIYIYIAPASKTDVYELYKQD